MITLQSLGRPLFAMIATCVASGTAGAAQTLAPPPPMKLVRFERLEATAPDLLRQLLARRVVNVTAVAGSKPGPSPWTPLAATPPINPGAMILLTDGSLMIQDQGSANNGTANWWRYAPDVNGSYVSGIWTQLASLPASFKYAPLYFASAVLPDGRVIIEGGEYNFGKLVWTNQGAIYDPLTNSWRKMVPPSGGTGNWVRIGDAPSAVLANGTFMLAASGYSGTTNEALLNARTLAWTETGAGKADGNGEEGWSLLPGGNLLTVDVDNPGAPSPTNSEIYAVSLGQWSSAGSTIVQLDSGGEIGPQLLRPAGSVLATGATQHNAVFDTASNSWSTAPDLPVIGGLPFDAADSSAAILPSGDVLVAASPSFTTPTHFFTFNGTSFTQVADTANAPNLAAFDGFMIVLPTGQVMFNSRVGDVELYSDGSQPPASLQPSITRVPNSLVEGSTYTLSGKQLCGLTQAAAYGDDYQPFTNYPLIRITNTATNHVFYARTSVRSSSSIAPSAVSSTRFTLPKSMETGASTLVVVANGIASKPVDVTIMP